MLNRHYLPSKIEEGASIPGVKARRLLLANSSLSRPAGFDPKQTLAKITLLQG